MKKTLSLLALAGVAGAGVAQAQLGGLTIDGTLAYESQYVSRGVNLAQHSFQPSVEFGLPVAGGAAYAGIWTMQPINDGPADGQTFGNEIDIYAGFGMDVTDIFSVDLGFQYYWYPDTSYETQEIYLGAAADVLLSPAVYFYYDFELETFTIEGSISYSFDLSEYAGISGASIDLGAYYGFLLSDAGEDGTYYGLTADLSYALSNNVKTSLGIRWAGNDGFAKANGGFGGIEGLGSNAPEGNKDTFWFGASIGFSY